MEQRRPREAEYDLYKWMPDALVAVVSARMRRRCYAAGASIYTQGGDGDEMFRIRSGLVRLSIVRSNGRELLQSVFFAGDCFGESSLIDGLPRPHTAQAHTDLEVDVLDRRAFNALRAVYRELDGALLRLMTTRMRAASTKLAQANLDQMRSRVAAKIIGFSQAMEGSQSVPPRLDLAFSQTDLAAMVGASRQSINKVLAGLQREGLVSLRYGRIFVEDLDRLERAAFGDEKFE